MERDFNNDWFEDFLKQKADQHKLYPSDRVWKNIYRSQHPSNKWIATGGIFLFCVSSLFIGLNHFTKRNATAHQSRTYSSPVATVFTGKKLLPVITIPSSSPVVTNTTVQVAPLAGKSVTAVRNNRHVQSISANNETDHAIAASTLHIVDGNALYASPEITAQVITYNPDQAADLPASDVKAVMPVDTQDEKPFEKNWLQERAIITLTPHREKVLKLQFYFSPTIGYRRLADNKTTAVNPYHILPVTSAQLNINRYVDHKPAIGVELGSNILLAAGRNLIIKTGLQLNYSRYNIQAYKFYNEKASIALNSVGIVADTITAFTSFRNFNGYSPETLQNQYVQVSMPVGAELKLVGNKRLQLNVAGTIQPSYMLFSNTYLLSTDYVNYAKEPSLMRNWNVHTSLEAFLSYKVGGLRWQVGPQFRYQLISSYVDRYPIKEYLMEYGVKFGVSKTLR